MSWTKKEFVLAAFEELGLSDANYNLQDSQLQTALKRLDSMMSSWNAKGIRLSYPLPSSPGDSNLDTDTTVPDAANEAIYLNLAIRIAPSFGKPVTQELKTSARDAYRILLSFNAYPVQEKQLSPLPKGAGYKTHVDNTNRFLIPNDNALDVGSDGELDLQG